MSIPTIERLTRSGPLRMFSLAAFRAAVPSQFDELCIKQYFTDDLLSSARRPI
jgi:hypothetical protein